MKIKVLLVIIHLVHRPNFPKNYHFLPLIHTRMCAYQGVSNVSFLENFAHVVNEQSHNEEFYCRFTLCFHTFITRASFHLSDLVL